MPVANGDEIVVSRSGTNYKAPVEDLANLFRYVAQIGNGSTNPITVTHNLGTKAVIVQMREVSTGKLKRADVEHPTVNTTKFTFAAAPTTNQYEVVITK